MRLLESRPPFSAVPNNVVIAIVRSQQAQPGLYLPPERTRKSFRRRPGSPSGRRALIWSCVRSQMGTARANNLNPLGVRAINRLRRSAVSVVTLTSPRRSNGFKAAVSVVRSIASKDATSAIAGGAGRFRDISNENCPFVRSSDRSASSKRRARARAAR
jgi:hypothetical protein